MNTITKPTLVLDKERCLKNIQKLVDKVKGSTIELRPHFKTHQSLEIGRWFKAYGINKITVSSLEMASYFADEWNDITVAFPTNILEVDTINRLAPSIQLNLLVESLETIDFLSKNLTSNIGAFIKIDVGTHRTGVAPDNYELLDTLLDQIKKSDKIDFKGFLGHAGHSYRSRSKEQIIEIHDKSRQIMTVLREKYQKEYPNIVISLGDTPTCSVAEVFSGIDEIRPGNYVLYDIMQVQIGSCNFDEIAAAVACPIVSIHKERNELIIYGGGVHFSKDSITTEEGVSFGQIVEKNEKTWGKPIKGMFVKGLSQEHGKIAVPSSEISKYKVGNVLYILPVHSCMTADLLKEYYTTTDERITMMNAYR